MRYLIALVLLCISCSVLAQSGVQSPRHHAGWAFSYAAATASTGRPAMMISTMYSYSIEEWCDLEASIHYIGRSWNGEFLIGLGRFHGTSWTFEATPMFHLSQTGFLKPFRVGLGVSVHSLKYLSNVINAVEPDIEYAKYSSATYVSGTFKIEYHIPLSQRVDVGIRGQLSIYPWEFQGVNQSSGGNLTTLGGLGVFACFNW